nr:hypothetical protein [Tanacetum cinerariifolium]
CLGLLPVERQRDAGAGQVLDRDAQHRRAGIVVGAREQPVGAGGGAGEPVAIARGDRIVERDDRQCIGCQCRLAGGAQLEIDPLEQPALAL